VWGRGQVVGVRRVWGGNKKKGEINPKVNARGDGDTWKKKDTEKCLIRTRQVG